MTADQIEAHLKAQQANKSSTHRCDDAPSAIGVAQTGVARAGECSRCGPAW